MSRPKKLYISTEEEANQAGAVPLPPSPYKNSPVNAPSPLANGGTKRRKSLNLDPASFPSSVFDFTELEKSIETSVEAQPKGAAEGGKLGPSPTCSPKSFMQRYDIFNYNQPAGSAADHGLVGWGNIQHHFLPPSTESVQSDLNPYILDTETRALILFHPPSMSPITIRAACQKYGVLYYLKSNFHSKGVTFFGYFDIRAAMTAQAKLSKHLSSAGAEVSVQYSVMLGESYNDSDAKLTLRNMASDVTESEIQNVFSTFGALSSIQRKFMVRPNDSPTHKGKSEPPPNLCEFFIEYFNIQDAKKAFDQIQPKVKDLFSSTAELQQCNAGVRWTKMLKTLTELLQGWKAALISQGIDCNSPVTWTGAPSPKFFPAKGEIGLKVDTSAQSDENSDPSSPCGSPSQTGRTKLVAPDDQPLVEIGSSVARSHSKALVGYRETELGYVEITPPVSPQSMPGMRKGAAPYFPEESAYSNDPSTETFHNYRQQLLLEHQKLLKMQEAILDRLPPEEQYPPYPRGAPSHLHHEHDEALEPRARESDRRYGGGGREYMNPPYPRGASEWRGQQGRGQGRGSYGESEYEQWTPSHGGPSYSRQPAPYHPPRADPRMQHGGNHVERWQGRPGPASRGDYGYDYDHPPMEYDRHRAGPHQEYRRGPAGGSGRYPHGGHYPAQSNGGGYHPPSRVAYPQESDRRYEQNWGERDRAQQDKANASFVVRVEDVLAGLDNRVTIMVKNIPNKYSQSMLLDEINSMQSVSYDFFYLPMDFRNRCNVGYAFINFTDRNDVVVFFSLFHGRKWAHFNSEKVCAVTYARIQGKQSLVMRYQNSSLLDREDSYKPLLFYSRGHPLEGQPEPFPAASGGNGGRSQGRGYPGQH